MSDKTKKKTIIFLTKKACLSCHPLPPPYLRLALMCMLCVCSDINIIVAYKNLSIIAY